MESGLDVCGVQRRCLYEGEVVLLRELLRLVRWDRAQVAQVRLVAHLTTKIVEGDDVDSLLSSLLLTSMITMLASA